MPKLAPLFTVQQIRQGEGRAAQECGYSLFNLMQAAGQAVFNCWRHHYPDSQHVAVFCGGGKNGGDGYIVATLLRQAGVQVTLYQFGDVSRVVGDAAQARQQYLDSGGEICNSQHFNLQQPADVIIDALLGIGIKGEVRPSLAQLFTLIESHRADVIAVDAPSGLNADTGQVLGQAIPATCSALKKLNT